MIRIRKMENAKYREKLNRTATNHNMDIAIEAATESRGDPPDRKTIWKAIRNKDLSRSIRYFFWMVLHDGYKIGKYWNKMPALADRGKCEWCEQPETMEHILTECDAPGQKAVWELASELWNKKHGEDLTEITFGEITACAAAIVGDPKKPNQGKTRLRRIIISEAAHLIWKLRNDRVINEGEYQTRSMIKKRWKHTMNMRLRMDQLHTNKARYKKKALKKSIVLNTWNKTLHNEGDLPPDWSRELGVLVGIS